MISPNESERRFLMTAGFEMALGVAAIALGLIFGPNPRQTIPPLSDTYKLAAAVGWGMIATLPMLGFALCLEWIPVPSFQKLRELTETQIAPIFKDMHWGHLVLIATAAGIGEELLFRGWLQSTFGGNWEQFARDPWRACAAFIVASVGFGACHSISRVYFIITAIFGFYLGAIFVWSESLLVPIVAHAVYDAVMLIWIFRRINSKPTNDAI